METDHFFSPAQAETHDGDKNLDVVPVHKVSLPAHSSKSPPCNTTDTLDISSQVEMPQVVFQNLPSGTTIDDVAKRLRAPPREGGCGVSILASAAIPPWDSVSFIVQFESLHEARIARLGWNSLALGSAVPAPQSLLSTVILTPYRPKTANTFVEQLNQNITKPDPSHRRFASTHNRRTPIPASQSHHPGPYFVPSRAVDRSLEAHAARSLPSTSSASRSSRSGPPPTRFLYHQNPAASRAVSNSSGAQNTRSQLSTATSTSQPDTLLIRTNAHRNYLGYMRRKGLIPRQN
jgi:hypothetical protein